MSNPKGTEDDLADCDPDENVKVPGRGDVYLWRVVAEAKGMRPEVTAFTAYREVGKRPATLDHPVLLRLAQRDDFKQRIAAETTVA